MNNRSSRTRTTFSNAKDKAREYLDDPEKIKELVLIAVSKLREIKPEQNERVIRFMQQVNTASRMIKQSINGTYQDLPWKSLLAITAGLIYFVTPVDVIPDFIPISGLLDDVSVMWWIFQSFSRDIEAFEEWEKMQQASTSPD